MMGALRLYYPKSFIEENREILEKLFPGVELVDILPLRKAEYYDRLDRKMQEISRKSGGGE